MSTQHLILGKLTDFISGKTLIDTLDERARQKIARFLVEQKGYSKEDIEPRRMISLTLDEDRGEVKVDFIIRLGKKAFAVIMFGPGSVVTRERSTLAVARLVESYVVPYAVVTNGKEAEILESTSGTVISQGLDSIPTRPEAMKTMETLAFETIPKERREKEKRILFAFEVLAERECDEYTCSLY